MQLMESRTVICRYRRARGCLLYTSLCHGSGEVKIDDCTVTEEGILVEGAVQVQILYVTSDDSHPMLCLKGLIPFEHQIEAPGIGKDSVYYLNAWLEQLSVDMVSSGELEVKAIIQVHALVFARRNPVSYTHLLIRSGSPAKTEKP